MTSRDMAGQPMTPVVLHVLMALAEGPLHGYGVMKRVEEESGITMGPGTVYGSLQRLEEVGWIVEAGPAPGDARRGNAFRLTAEGKAALLAEGARLARLARRVGGLDLEPEPARSRTTR
jgi:DNA-binding PadR family transcriptional regulator